MELCVEAKTGGGVFLSAGKVKLKVGFMDAADLRGMINMDEEVCKGSKSAVPPKHSD